MLQSLLWAAGTLSSWRVVPSSSAFLGSGRLKICWNGNSMLSRDNQRIGLPKPQVLCPITSLPASTLSGMRWCSSGQTQNSAVAPFPKNSRTTHHSSPALFYCLTLYGMSVPTQCRLQAGPCLWATLEGAARPLWGGCLERGCGGGCHGGSAGYPAAGQSEPGRRDLTYVRLLYANLLHYIWHKARYTEGGGLGLVSNDLCG